MLDDWLPFPFEPLGSLLVAQGPLWLPWSNMDHLFRPKSTDLRCLCFKMSIWELSWGLSGNGTPTAAPTYPPHACAYYI